MTQNPEVTGEKEELRDTHTRHDLGKFIDTETIQSYAKVRTNETTTCDQVEKKHDDDPRKGSEALENNRICTSNESQRNVFYRNENRTYNSTESKAEKVGEEGNISTDPQEPGSTRGIPREETVALHTSYMAKNNSHRISKP